MTPHYDIHCHVFNKNVLVRKLVNIVQTLLMLEELIEQNISGEEMKCRIEGILTTLDEVTKPTSEAVFQYLNEKYQSQLTLVPLMFDLTYTDDNDGNLYENKQYKNKIKKTLWLFDTIIPLLKKLLIKKYPEIDWEKIITELHENIRQLIHQMKKGSPGDLSLFDDANYDQQIIELEGMAKKYSNIKPFFGIDPRREYRGGPQLIATVQKKILDTDACFSGIKMYAPAGFSPTNQLLMGNDEQTGLYALCVQHNIPITVHNSNAGFACFSNYLRVNGHIHLDQTIQKVNGVIKFNNEFIGIRNKGAKLKATTGDAIKERASTLNHPRLWKLVLEKYPALTINFAHFGGSGQIMEYVHYDIPQKTLSLTAFEKAIHQSDARGKKLLQTHYQHKGKLMVLDEQLPFTERAKLWNALYHLGIIDNWAKAIFDLISDPKHPNAYTDLSCFSQSKFIQATPETADPHFSIRTSLDEFKYNFFDKLTDYEQSKFMYGSDFFLSQFFGPKMEHYYRDFKNAFGADFSLIASENPHRFLHRLKKTN